MLAAAEAEDTAKFGQNQKVVDKPVEKKLTAKQKKALKKKQEDEELDRLLGLTKAPEPEPEPGAEPAEDGAEPPDDAKLSAAQKKKVKKKRQEAAKKAEKEKAAAAKVAGAGGGAESDDKSSSAAEEKLTMEFIMSKPKKVQKILLAKLAQQEQKEAQEEAERIAKAEWEAEQKELEEEEAEKQRKKDLKKQRKKEKDAADRAAGKAVTHKEKAAEAKAAAYREQIEAQKAGREEKKAMEAEAKRWAAEQVAAGVDLSDEEDEVDAEEDTEPEPEPELAPTPEPETEPEEVVVADWDDDEDADDVAEDSQDGITEDSDEEDIDEYDSDGSMDATDRRIEAARDLHEKNLEKALKHRTPDELRSPICCVLGHVDTGKTKVLDKIRQTNVQDNEAGGITQQIGATFFPINNLKVETDKIPRAATVPHNIPGMLIIDTPGHESFSNLRTRGSGLCDIAILVVDIMHGLEPQTIESIGLLKMRKTPFVIALNKVDRCFDWVECPNTPIRQALNKQPEHTKMEFEDRLQKTLVLFAEQEINAIEYWKNKDLNEYVSIIPTSAISGEGIPDLLLCLIEYTQSRMCLNSVMYHPMVECTVLEVKVIEGLGTTIDVILVNGVLYDSDTIVVCGLNGAIVAQVRTLLTPQPMRELRVKSAYQHHKIIKGAQGIKIAAPGLEEAIAGSGLMVCRNPANHFYKDDPSFNELESSDIDFVKEEIEGDLEDMLSNIEKTGRGVYVQASTLGSLEALLEFLRTSKIPVSGISIGPVHRKDVVKASAQLEFRAMYAAVMAFDVPVDRDAKEFAEKIGVKIFTADIIYHLFDQFTCVLSCSVGLSVSVSSFSLFL